MMSIFVHSRAEMHMLYKEKIFLQVEGIAVTLFYSDND